METPRNSCSRLVIKIIASTNQKMTESDKGPLSCHDATVSRPSRRHPTSLEMLLQAIIGKGINTQGARGTECRLRHHNGSICPWSCGSLWIQHRSAILYSVRRHGSTCPGSGPWVQIGSSRHADITLTRAWITSCLYYIFPREMRHRTVMSGTIVRWKVILRRGSGHFCGLAWEANLTGL